MGFATTRVTFIEHITKMRGSYKCACGARFQRTQAEGWTENPFHQWQGRERELDKEKADKAREKLATQECPKCDATVAATKVIPW
jgi:hypothetical protein